VSFPEYCEVSFPELFISLFSGITTAATFPELFRTRKGFSAEFDLYSVRTDVPGIWYFPIRHKVLSLASGIQMECWGEMRAFSGKSHSNDSQLCPTHMSGSDD